MQGVAHAFDRGFVTYSEEAKTEMLGVPAALIADEGRGLEGGRGRDGRGRAGALARPYRACRSPASPTPATSRAWSISPARAQGRITAHREEHFGADRAAARTRVAALEVAVEMMTEML